MFERYIYLSGDQLATGFLADFGQIVKTFNGKDGSITLMRSKSSPYYCVVNRADKMDTHSIILPSFDAAIRQFSLSINQKLYGNSVLISRGISVETSELATMISEFDRTFNQSDLIDRIVVYFNGGSIE